MSKVRWFYFLFAAGFLALAARTWLRGKALTPESCLASANERIESETPDYEGALRELACGLELAREGGRPDLERELLQARVRLFGKRRDADDFDLTLLDCQSILALPLPPEPELYLLAGRTALIERRPDLALEWSQDLARLDPENTEGDRLAGLAHMALARSVLQEVDQLLQDALAESAAHRLSSAVRRASALVEGSPLRRAALEEVFAGIKSSQDERRVREAVDEAHAHYLAAAQAFTRRLQSAPDGKAVAGLQEIFLEAGATNRATALGNWALTLRDLDYRPVVLARTAIALETLGRRTSAKQLIDEVHSVVSQHRLDPGVISTSELIDWCALLYRLELWTQLETAANKLGQRRQRKELRSLYRFYRGRALLGMGRHQSAEGPLRAFPKPIPELFVGVNLEAWMASAEVARKLKKRLEERFCVAQATRSIPAEIQDTRLYERAGEAWLRLSDFQSSENDPLSAEESLTEALRLLPRRRAEVQERWEARGREAMVARGRRPTLSQRSKAPRLSAMGPYEKWLYAEEYLERGNARRAQALAQDLLTRHPGLPVALEVLALAAHRRGEIELAIDAQLELAEHGFVRARNLRLLRGIEVEQFTGEQLIRWMLVDPRNAGLVMVARELERSGRTQLAVQTFSLQRGEGLAPEDVAYVAQLFGRTGKWETCLEWLLELPSRSPVFAANLGLALRAALEVSKEREEEDPLRQLLQRCRNVSLEHLDPNLHIGIDALLAGGATPIARAVLTTLDERLTRAVPALLLRRAVADTIAHHKQSASEALERAEAFFEDGSASIGWLLRAVDDQDTDALAAAARELLRTPFGADPYHEAILRALLGDVFVASDSLARLDETGTDARLVFASRIVDTMLPPGPTDISYLEDGPSAVHGGDPWEGLDAQSALAMLVALESRPWSSWALSRLQHFPKNLKTRTWVTLMEAVALVQLEEYERADALLSELTGPEGGVPMAYVMRERIAVQQSGGRLTPKLATVRSQRVNEVGKLDTPEEELTVTFSRALTSEGFLERALAVVERALGRFPDDVLLRLEHARLVNREGQRARALEEYQALYAEPLEHELAREVAPEMIALLHAARTEGEISDSFFWAELEALGAQLTDEPLVARELAVCTLEMLDPQTVQSAFDHLTRFRSRTGGIPVDSLRPGEGLEWTSLFRRHNPELAVDFARSELAANPASPELWRAWCEALVSAGRYAEARKAYEAILTIVPEPALIQSYANFLTEQDETTELLKRTLAGLERVEGAAFRDPEVRFQYALTLIASKQKHRGFVIMDEVWSERVPHRVETGALSRRYAQALVRASKFERAQEVLAEAALEALDPFEESFLRSSAAVLAHRTGRNAR